MTIRYAIASDKNSLKQIWFICFGDEDDYVEHFLRERWTGKNCLVAEEDGNVVAMLFLLPAEIRVEEEWNPVWYIYACATLPGYRGGGFMRQLLLKAGEEAVRQSVFALVLVPASDSLYNYYEKSGFSRLYKKPVKGCVPAVPGNKEEVVTEQLVAEILSIRNSVLTGELDICWGKDHMRFVLDDLARQNGGAVFTKDGYALLENRDGEFAIKEQLPEMLQMTAEDYAMIRFCRPYTIKTSMTLPYFNLGLD